MTQKLNWMRWILTLALGWQWLGLAAPAYADTVYIVQPGDNLYRISLRFGVSQQALMAANHLTNASWIYAGQQLVIPEVGAAGGPVGAAGGPAGAAGGPVGAATTSALPAASVQPVAFAVIEPTPGAAPPTQIYTVRAGDILQRIATKFGVSVQALMAANGLSNANFIMVGQRLVIPAGGSSVPAPVVPGATEVTPTPPGNAPADAATPVPSIPSSANNTVYVVKAGDTLWGISRHFGLSLAVLKSMNGLYNDYVHVGQPLTIPGPDATPEVPPTVEALPPASLPAWIPTISWHARGLYASSIEHGHAPNAFSVAGDCNSDYALYLGPVARNVVGLNDTFYLVNIVNRFSRSINRTSLAVHGGFNARSVMDPMWANPTQCRSGERPLDCELRVNNSSIVFIALGTGDQFAWRDFEKNYRWMIQAVVDQHVLPVLVTKADTLESQQGGAEPYFIDEVIRRLGREFDVPVLDLQLAVQDLPNHGLIWEGGQDFHLSSEGNTQHNIITLQTLYVITRGW